MNLKVYRLIKRVKELLVRYYNYRIETYEKYNSYSSYKELERKDGGENG